MSLGVKPMQAVSQLTLGRNIILLSLQLLCKEYKMSATVLCYKMIVKNSLFQYLSVEIF